MTSIDRIRAADQGAAKVHCQLKLRADGHLWRHIADESREPEAAILDELTEGPSWLWHRFDCLSIKRDRNITAHQRLRNLGLIERCAGGWKATNEGSVT